MEGLDDWDAPFGAQELRQVVQEGLQSPVSDRGRPVGSGVYLGPPAGIAGADYARVYVVGMVEKQFPPRGDNQSLAWGQLVESAEGDGAGAV